MNKYNNRPPTVQEYVNSKIHSVYRYRDCVCGTLGIAIVITIVAIIIASSALCIALYSVNNKVYKVDSVISNSPFSVQLSSTSALAMTLPNNLKDYVGRTFHVYSVTAVPHTITISSIGSLTTSWDGVNTIATFGGAIGDGITFHIIDIDKISIISNTNVVLSS